MIWFALYIATIFGANWLLTTFGIVTILPGLSAPAGVFCAGLAFVFRNQTQETLGRRWSVAAIPIGAALSAFLSPTFALASGAAFLLAESLDYIVYQPLRRRGRIRAMLVSCACGDVADSALFLLLAFHSLDFIEGQIVGKWLTVVPVVIGMWLWRRGNPVSERGRVASVG
jgi:uncharacterized PurR-regulated membrane protein YhhQ (DUF165 family)